MELSQLFQNPGKVMALQVCTGVQEVLVLFCRRLSSHMCLAEHRMVGGSNSLLLRHLFFLALPVSLFGFLVCSYGFPFFPPPNSFLSIELSLSQDMVFLT